MKYPLNECSDCIHRNGCELLAKTRFWNSRNTEIDLSEAHCKKYTPDYENPVDDDWKNYNKSNKPAVQDITYEELQDSPHFMALEDAIDLMHEQGYVPIKFELSTEFINEMMPEKYKNEKYKVKSLLGIKVVVNDSLGLQFHVIGEDPENGDTVGITYYPDYEEGDEDD